MKYFIVAILVVIFFAISPSNVMADTLVFSYGPSSITNSNGFLVSKIDNLQVYYPFVPGHSYRLDITGAINPNTFWIGICNDANICNSSAANYTNDGDFSVNFIDINSQWFDIWGNCAGFGTCSITGAYLYDVSIGSTPTPTPTLVPTNTPTPTSTPIATPTATSTPTSIPVTKVFFIPGFGASWNASAFASCIQDNDPSHWSLASYATNVYNGILTTLASSGWTTIPFYYDWRQIISNNSSVLTSFVNGRIGNNEKFNLVGHSMGGLVARQYLEDTSGQKINKLLTAGSPHQGIPTAYPAWSAGDIWQDNFITKIAMTLYLKHCAGVFTDDRTAVQQNIPSVNNLLPIFNYLKNTKSVIFKDWSSMIVKNYWHNSNDYDSHGVETETLSGYGFSTLQEIQIKDPSKTDIKNGDWLDGKPSGKIYSTNGDGTVLENSSTLPGVSNVTLNQTHSGLVTSVDGMAEILRFLGTTNSSSLHSNFTEPNSALVLIGYPGNFWITDQKGHTQKDKNGMISFINPESDSFRLNLIPQINNTLFVIAQFLPNGQVYYKEYRFSGFTPKLKTIKFDLKNPTEDILN
ncbi:MAG TPA: alpha/beta fold hydrolase [Patescibacteria group bacterium]|nr:alpha/beta fold hydrolase [Patescibacteria group bacterium]